MRPGPGARLLLRGLHHYRHSTLQRRTAGCCRFAPTCSHYAEHALRMRALPVALVLIAWRLLRCTPRTPLGTYDPVGPRRHLARKAAAVLSLSGLTVLLVTTTASAAGTVAAPRLPAAGFSGGCAGTVGGQRIGDLDRDHPLQVHKGQPIVLRGAGPLGDLTSAQAKAIESHTDVSIYYIEKVGAKHFGETGHGTVFGRTINVNTYLKYGSGLYRVDVHSEADEDAWDCLATFYVEMHGSKLAAEAAVVVGGLGVLGVGLAGGGGDPPVPDPPVEPEHSDENPNEAAPPVPTKDTAANVGGIAAIGCFMAMILAAMDLTDAPWIGVGAVLAPSSGGSSRRVWVRGRPVLGTISGLIAGLGLSLAGQQLNRWSLTPMTVFVVPVLFAILGGLRGWRGRAWRV